MLPAHIEIEICDVEGCALGSAETAEFCRAIVVAVRQCFGCPVTCVHAHAIFDEIRVHGTSLERELQIREEVTQIIQDVWLERFEDPAREQ